MSKSLPDLQNRLQTSSALLVGVTQCRPAAWDVTLNWLRCHAKRIHKQTRRNKKKKRRRKKTRRKRGGKEEEEEEEKDDEEKRIRKKHGRRAQREREGGGGRGGRWWGGEGGGRREKWERDLCPILLRSRLQEQRGSQRLYLLSWPNWKFLPRQIHAFVK